MEGTDTDTISKAEEESATNGSPSVDVSEAAIAIRKYVENAKSEAKEVADMRTSIASALADSRTKLADIEIARTQALAAKTKIEADQTVIATKSAHIQDAQEHADKVRANLDREQTAATKHATDAEGQKTRAQAAADSATEILTAARTTKATAETDAEAIEAIRKTAEESTAITKGLADKSTTIETRILAYETQLDDLRAQCDKQLKTIDNLLPGAASAGLASSFGERRQTFSSPKRKWETWFIGALIAIGALATVGFVQLQMMATPTWDAVLAFWLMRAPLAVPLVWLAIHASREAALAKRLEEDYGYKAAMASCFEGFRKQMSEIADDVKLDHPLGKLCADTLKTIASPPGQIYEKHKLTVTPADMLAQSANIVKDAVGPHLKDNK